MHGARRVAVYLAMLGVAAVLGLVVLGTAVAAVVLALDLVLPAWAAALVVCAAAALVAGPLALAGAIGLKRAPRATTERVEEDVRWTTPR